MSKNGKVRGKVATVKGCIDRRPMAIVILEKAKAPDESCGGYPADSPMRITVLNHIGLCQSCREVFAGLPAPVGDAQKLYRRRGWSRTVYYRGSK